MELQGEDLNTFNRLRAKYAGHSCQAEELDAALVDPNAPGVNPVSLPSTAAGLGYGSSNGPSTDVRMCAICQGLGVCKEDYNHRVLERYCTACRGQGVHVYKDGVEVVAPQATLAHSSSNASSQQETTDSALTDKDAAQLQQELSRLAVKLASYQQEQDQLAASLASCNKAQELVARQELAAQLASHVKRLRGIRARKEAQLCLAGRSIIANS